MERLYRCFNRHVDAPLTASEISGGHKILTQEATMKYTEAKIGKAVWITFTATSACVNGLEPTMTVWASVTRAVRDEGSSRRWTREQKIQRNMRDQRCRYSGDAPKKNARSKSEGIKRRRRGRGKGRREEEVR